MVNNKTKNKFMSLEITSKNFKSLLSDKKVLVVDFWAPWCGPCRTLGPIVDKVADNNDDMAVGVGKVDVDDNGSLGRELGVRSVPTIIFFKDGVEVERLVGIKTRVELEEMIAKIK